ncbi:hypothetical protein G6F63_015812 [Rhizopus arrhizus]|nr:hypothetical protein G6F63_015812 [Rhizopus arrhizus]
MGAERHDVAAGASQVFDDDRLAQPLRQRFGQQARQRVGRAAGRKAHQQPHGFCGFPRIGGDRRGGGRQGGDGEQGANGAVQGKAEHERTLRTIN